MALAMRIQLEHANNQVISADAYDRIFTMHGTTMIFLFVVPVMAAFGNYMVPLMIGARDMAFPRLNAASLLAPDPRRARACTRASLWGGGAADAGWTAYPPLSVQSPGHGHRPLDRRPPHHHDQLGDRGHQLHLHDPQHARARHAAHPDAALRLDRRRLRVHAAARAAAALGGAHDAPARPQLRHDLLRRRPPTGRCSTSTSSGAFGHPEVYVVALPGFGMISEIVPVFSRKPLFGYRALVYATVAIAFLGFLVWGHHMFAVGMSTPLQVWFMLASMAIAVPTGRQDLQLDRDDVDGPDPVRAADALRHRVHPRVPDRRPLGHRARDLPVRPVRDRQLLRRRPLPLRDGEHPGLRGARRPALLVSRR